MTKDFYILLRASITGRLDKSQVCVDVNWAELMEMFAQQAIVGQVFGVVEDNYKTLSVNTEQKLNWYAQTMGIRTQNAKQNKVLFLLVKALNGAGLPSLLLKGQGCAQFYPKPMYHVCGDIDLLVGEENFDRAMTCLQEAGLVDCIGHSDRKHTSLTYQGVSIEMHRYALRLSDKQKDHLFQGMMGEALREKEKLDYGFCVNADGSYGEKAGCVFVKTLPTDLNVVYVFIHMFRHFIQGGVRLKQVCDWLCLCQHIEDEKQVGKQLKDLGFLDIWQVFAKMAVEYMGMQAEMVPLNIGGDQKKARRVHEILEKGGITSCAVNKRGLWARFSGILSLYFACFKAFRIFPKQCIGYLLDIMNSNVQKHILRRSFY